MECCVEHGLPIHCIQQNLDSKTSAHHNDTHVVVTSILSKECHDYKKILKECKAECVGKVKSVNIESSNYYKVTNNPYNGLLNSGYHRKPIVNKQQPTNDMKFGPGSPFHGHA